MRYPWLALAGVLMVCPALNGQQPPATAPPANPQAANQRLDVLLKLWEEKMGAVQGLAAECTRTTLDKTYQGTEVFVGTAKFMRPNYAALEMAKKNNPQVMEKYLCTGTFLYEYVPQSKLIRVHELPPPRQGQVSDDNTLSFLFGMKAEEARRRYELRLVKEDQHYVYVEIQARFAADKADFQRARLVLLNGTFLPRQLWFEQPNGNEVTWDILKLDPNARLGRTDFAPPEKLPAGWQMQRIPRPQAPPANSKPPEPRVIRPNQP